MASRPRNDVVSVLASDPDLGEDLTEPELAAATPQALARSRWHARGAWSPPRDLDPTGSLGLLLVRGFIARWVTVGDYTAAELLGPGDVLQPWLRPALEQPVAVEIEWTVVQQARILLLDGDFTARMSGWPQITAAISRRLTWRTHWLTFQLALSALRRVDDRVTLMLWQFAGRWGTVTPEGILLDMPLTHELLAALVGARRPSISAAVRRLVDQGLIRPRPRSRWLLLGAAPAETEAAAAAER